MDCGYRHGECKAPDTQCSHWKGTFCELDMMTRVIDKFDKEVKEHPEIIEKIASKYCEQFVNVSEENDCFRDTRKKGALFFTKLLFLFNACTPLCGAQRPRFLFELPAFHDRQLVAAVIILVFRVVSPQDFCPAEAPDIV